MKNILLLMILTMVTASHLWAQVTHISGTTKFKTKVTYGEDALQDKIPGGYAVEIVDANNYFFTIKYNDGVGYVNRNHIDYDAAELAELLRVKDGLADLNGGGPISHSEVEDSYKYEIDHIRYSLGKYHRQMKAGYFFGFIGAAAVASPSFLDYDDRSIERTVEQVGIGLGILGGLLIIDSNKWMKRIYFGPEGVGIRYSFGK